MQVAFYSAQQNLSRQLHAAIGEQWAQDIHRSLHGARRTQHLGDKHVSGLKFHADMVHPGHQAVVEHLLCFLAFIERLHGQVFHDIQVAFDDSSRQFRQRLAHLLLAS